MSAIAKGYRITGADLAATLRSIAERNPRINIVPTVMDFGAQDECKLQALARAASKVSESVHGGMRFAQMMSASDFRVLEQFVEFARGEFAIAGTGLVRDDKPDQQHSPHETDFRDRERL